MMMMMMMMMISHQITLTMLNDQTQKQKIT